MNVNEIYGPVIQGEGPSAGLPTMFLRLATCNLHCSFCFHKSTLITTLTRGKVPITEINEGEVILTLDSKKDIVETTVKKILQRQVDISNMRVIKFSDFTYPIWCTKDHPFFIKNRGWIKCDNLKEGDVVLHLDDYQSMSYKMKKLNPMKNKETAKKTGQEISRRYAEGLIIPYKRTQEIRARMSASKMGDLNPMKNPETVKKSAMNHFKGKSKLEEKAELIFSRSSIPVQYVGNNQLPIGDKEKGYRFPDFRIKEANKLIELYDTTMEYIFKGKKGLRGWEWEEVTKSHYSQFGYEVLFITEKDLRYGNPLQKLYEFYHNGRTVKSVKVVGTKERARLYGSANIHQVDVYNLACEPYNTYLANGCLVHNCDTKYTWDWKNYDIKKELKKMSIDEVVAEIIKSSCNNLTISGGEPMMQQTSILELLRHPEFKRWRNGGVEVVERNEKWKKVGRVEIETNGTLAAIYPLDEQVTQFNVSPKLSNNKADSKEKRWPMHVLKMYACNPKAVFKFVIENEGDLQEVLELQLLLDLNSSQICLMPQVVDKDKYQERAIETMDLAKNYGFRFSPRLHVEAFGAVRGV